MALLGALRYPECMVGDTLNKKQIPRSQSRVQGQTVQDSTLKTAADGQRSGLKRFQKPLGLDCRLGRYVDSPRVNVQRSGERVEEIKRQKLQLGPRLDSGER